MKKRLPIMLLFSLGILPSTTSMASQTFDDVLVIVNFNWPFYDNIPFLKEMYGKVFPNMVFYGEKAHPNVETISTDVGYYAQRTLAHAMHKWPHYNGYIWVSDDCMINFWRFTTYDKTKLWIIPWIPAKLNALPSDWNCWQSPCGYPVLKPAYDALPPYYKEMLESNLGCLGVQRGPSEFFYFPAQYREDVVKLCDQFSNVFVEIAFPTLCACLCPLNECVCLSGVSVWGDERYKIGSFYSPEVDWVHPIKFSVSSVREFIQKIVTLHTQP